MKSLLQRLNSISVKVVFAYLSLAVVTIAFFTSIVFENQADLITDNTRLHAEKKISSIISLLQKRFPDTGFSPGGTVPARDAALARIGDLLRPLVGEYAVFTETGEVVITSGTKDVLQPTYLQDGLKAIAARDFTGREYFVRINESEYRMYFYIPLPENLLRGMVLCIPWDVRNLPHLMQNLYRQVVLIFLVIAALHVLFALLFYRMIVRPVGLLRQGSERISRGDLRTRVRLERNDEIGELAQTFNMMAASIQEKVEILEATNDEMEAINEYVDETNRSLEEAKRIADRDMEMAVNVQRNFLPQAAPACDGWDTAFVFEPATGVSGDFYDFYSDERGLFGVSVFDVSGHGIASGLITMLAKVIAQRAIEGMRDAGLGAVVTSFNSELVGQIDSVDNYITGIMLRLRGGAVEYVNAGHPDLLLRKGSTGEVIVVGGGNEEFRGALLGIGMLSRDYAVLTLELEPGDALLAYTDCLCEGKNPEGKHYDLHRLIDSLRRCPSDVPARSMLEHLVRDYREFIQDVRPIDDLTAVLLKRV